MKQVNFKDIEDFCDDPALPGQVTATLQLEKGKGYKLSLSSGSEVATVVVNPDRPFYFISVESALANLVDVPNLSRHLVIDLPAFGIYAF